MSTNDLLLADFIGHRLPSINPGRLPGEETPISQQWSFPFLDEGHVSLRNMKFDESWDWLFPCIKKAKDLHYKLANGQLLYRKIELALMRLYLDEAREALIHFIAEYNKQLGIRN